MIGRWRERKPSLSIHPYICINRKEKAFVFKRERLSYFCFPAVQHTAITERVFQAVRTKVAMIAHLSLSMKINFAMIWLQIFSTDDCIWSSIKGSTIVGVVVADKNISVPVSPSLSFSFVRLFFKQADHLPSSCDCSRNAELPLMCLWIHIYASDNASRPFFSSSILSGFHEVRAWLQDVEARDCFCRR